MSMLDLPDSVTFNFPTPILFGLGVRREIGTFLKENGLSRPLIVTDEGIAPLPMLHDLKVLLEGDGRSVPRLAGSICITVSFSH